MFYNARWYDSSLGRFAQADTIISSGVQGLDRYAYSLNSPINYVDPSGHDPYSTCGGNSACMSYTTTNYYLVDTFDAQAGITFTGNWDNSYKTAARKAVWDVGKKLAEKSGGPAATSFKKVFNQGVNFVWDPKCDGCRAGTVYEQNKKGKWVDTDKACGSDYVSYGCVPGGGLTSWDGKTITFASMSGGNVGNVDWMVHNAVHELGHAFYHTIGNPLLGSNSFSRDALLPNPCKKCYDWQQHPPSMNASGEDIPTELFGDTFIAWTYGEWNTNPSLSIALAVDNAQKAMDSLVPRP